MTNEKISQVFKNISNLLQIKGENSYRQRSYERAATLIEELQQSIAQLAIEDNLRTIPGIGQAIESKTIEILETGTCKFYEELKCEIGADVLSLLQIRGIGIKSAARLYHDANIKSLVDLRHAVDGGLLKNISGFGQKTIQTIDQNLQHLEFFEGKRILGQILPIANEIFGILKECNLVKQIDFTGDLRRYEEILQSLELVIVCDDLSILLSLLSTLDHIEALEIKDSRILAEISNGFPVEIHNATRDTYSKLLFSTTAEPEHLQSIHDLANNKGLTKDEWMHGKTEVEIYTQLNLPYIVPELRKSKKITDLALTDEIPDLIELSDIRSDLHMHTSWSDGLNSVKEMIKTAQKIGYNFIAITDHSQSSRIANGLDSTRLFSQIEQISDLNERIDGLDILAGSEVDILKDGQLDFSDQVLSKLDVVVASVHSNFGMNETDMTKRLIRAIENPFVDILGHPTGRLLMRRPEYALNPSAVIDAAIANRVALEINA
ncbi:MAG: PHP domain-containing protein, partial [Candidatus Poribacteria bacterium]|nr:PHP domain-containing protein [Candidatus Poribacteria bacterium]